ncbi:hypothetical protein LPJ66_005554 [Kickxella alabastrina]|uniref:Uncharacterized protein n=1 Tax=Kickxella alabastrina TaxID=61397 RepID=A0ACC1IET0_9FUNG|nr:hypothetical protein LPJ66_005554 [Kickxella alabastrina]
MDKQAGPAPNASSSPSASVSENLGISTNITPNAETPEAIIADTPKIKPIIGRRGIGNSKAAGESSSEHAPSVSSVDLRGTPTTQHAAVAASSAESGNGRLGLRAPSLLASENASMYSNVSAAGSISADSKPPSQKASGMSLVRRLRKLSSAAISGKVNRLFSRSNNPSQDSLPTSSSPSSPIPITAHIHPPVKLPKSPSMPARSEFMDNYRGRTSSSFGATNDMSTHMSTFPLSHAQSIPPVPLKPLSARRNRAMSEITPLSIRNRLDAEESESPDGGNDVVSHRMAQSRAKAINSPLVASPLSRKSFHAIHAQSGCDNDMVAEEHRAQSMVKSANDSFFAMQGPVTPPPFGKGASPKLTRTPTANSIDMHRPPMPHRLSYQYTDDYASDMVSQAANIPSPSERLNGRPLPQLANDSLVPSFPRRRTALATLGWSEHTGGTESGLLHVREQKNSTTTLLSNGIPGDNLSTMQRLNSGSTMATDSPSSLLAAFQVRSNAGSGLFRQSTTGASARSSTSITSDSAQSWASALLGGDIELDDDNENNLTRRHGSGLSMVATSAAHQRYKRSGADGAITAEGADYSQGWPPAAGKQALFDASIRDWRQLSQDGSSTLCNHSPASSSAQIMPAMLSNPFGASENRTLDTASGQGTKPKLHGIKSDVAIERYATDLSDYEAGSTRSSPSNSSSHGGSPAYAITQPSSTPVGAQPIRPRGGSQLVHLARAATTNAIRLKEREFAAAGESGGSNAGSVPPMSSTMEEVRLTPGSAPEPSNIDLAIERSKIQPRVRATSASSQPFAPINSIAAPGSSYDESGYSTSAGTGQSQNGNFGRGGASSSAVYVPTSRPPSSISGYTMSPVSSTMGDDGHHGAHQGILSHMWQPAPSSTSSSPAHPYIHGHNHGHGSYHYHHHSNSGGGGSGGGSGANSQGGHQLRLNMASVQRSASGHSVSSGISELLEPSSVSQVRKEALWQILVVSKSRADTEIDKMMRQWRETDGGAVVCTLDADAKPGLGDEDAIILKVKRGHRRSTSDMKRADGDRNEFRRRVIELAHLIRSSSVSELSNDVITRNITEQLYGLLTEHRARFVSDTNVGTLIVDMLYQFSAVSQTVSQLAMSFTLFSGVRNGVSGDASPAISQFPSPQLAPESSLGRGGLSMLPSLSSALSSHYESASGRNSAPSQKNRDAAQGLPNAAGELGDYRIGRVGSEGSYPSGSISGRIRPLDSVSYASSPRALPTTAHSSTASLHSLLAPVNSANNSTGGSFGRSIGAPSQYQRQRMYFPAISTTSHSNRPSVELPDSESEASGSARPSLDDSLSHAPLNRHASKLSVSSDAVDSQMASNKRSSRASIQPHHFFNHFARLQHQQEKKQQEEKQPSQDPANPQPEEAGSSSSAPVAPKRAVRPATMYISSTSGNKLMRRVSESVSRQERLANLLSHAFDPNESMPDSPLETPVRPFFDAELPVTPNQPLSPTLGTILETRLGSESGPQETSSQRVSLAAALEVAAGSHTSASSGKLTSSPHKSVASQILEIADDQDADQQLVQAHGADANAMEAMAPADADLAIAESSDNEMVVCRICERDFYKYDLNLHSDVCMLEQTRAMKLDEANQRVRRLRDSVSKRLGDLRKARQWDKVAIREAERVVRIADRAIVWPEGDTQHELIVAKSKFTKYIEKLETITGSNGNTSSPTRSKGQSSFDAPMSSVAAVATLPRADVETIWLAKRLLVRIHDKCTIIEEFDKEFSRLERQEALTREAELANADIEPEPVQPNGQFLELPTWSQLAQHTGQRSPAASERTSMDFMHLQSESGSATPDVAGGHALGISKGLAVPTRRHSKQIRPGRSARPTPDLIDIDSQSVTSASPASGGSGGSGSRKLVSLFAALFRNNHMGFGRTKDSTGPSVLRRKNTSSAFSPTVLPSISRSSSALRRLSQNMMAGQPTITTPVAISFASAQAAASVPSAGVGTGTEAVASTATATATHGSAPSEMDSAVNPSAAILTASPSDVPLSSPVTRQRNNSQLSSMRTTPESASKVQRMPSIDDFDFVKPISRGAFGRVYLTRKKATKDLYAIKVMRKKDMINKNMVTQALAERRALSLLSTEWVVQLYYAFHSSKHLFLVMEYLVGGDLAGLLRVWGVMEEDAAKFYIAEIANAIDYLHCNSIVHRDIKPDNIILASDGHIKLTDFGLSQVAVRGNATGSKVLVDGSDSNVNLDSPTSDSTPLGDTDVAGRLPDKSEDYWNAAVAQAGRSVQTPVIATNSTQAGKALPLSKRAHARKSSRGFLGTPDYLAPELLLGAGNGLAVDWWALGVCLFEFVCGYPPFTDESPEAIFRNILNHAIDWPEEEGYVSQEVVEMINALLSPDPTTRAHWKDIKAARLFEGWDMSAIRQMEPPFVPQPDDDVDTSYFEPCQRSEMQRLSNATFLQVDAAKRLPPTPRQQSARATEIVPSPESTRGSQRGSRRGRSASGSASANNGRTTSASVGQLKKLFSDMSAEDNAFSAKIDSAHEAVGYSEMDAGEQCQSATSIVSASSSDRYSFTDNSADNNRVNIGLGNLPMTSPRARIPFAALPAAAMGEDSDVDMAASLRGRSSINSLSEAEFEEQLPSRRVISVQAPAGLSAVPSSQTSAVRTLGILPPPLLINHARRLVGRSPTQNSDGPVECGPSSPSTKSHSRCASINIVMAKSKINSQVRSRRPSDGPDNSSESEMTVPLVRSSSTDDRAQSTSIGGSVVELAANGNLSGSAADSDSMEGDDDDDDAEDEETERVFEDFTYKNLALLSHVNKGVSSSGHATPMSERLPLGATISTTVSLSAHGSALASARESPINAYDTKQDQSSDKH